MESDHNLLNHFLNVHSVSTFCLINNTKKTYMHTLHFERWRQNGLWGDSANLHSYQKHDYLVPYILDNIDNYQTFTFLPIW